MNNLLPIDYQDVSIYTKSVRNVRTLLEEVLMGTVLVILTIYYTILLIKPITQGLYVVYRLIKGLPNSFIIRMLLLVVFLVIMLLGDKQ